jgi:hypothetical protein
LFEQWGKGTMIMMDTEQAKTVEGMHFSPQHHADSKGDLSGQHDPSFSPLIQLVMIILPAADTHGWAALSVPEHSNF